MSLIPVGVKGESEKFVREDSFVEDGSRYRCCSGIKW